MAFPANRGNWYKVKHLVGAVNRDVTSAVGSWSSPGGAIVNPASGLASGPKVLTFDLHAQGYFTPSNQGHIAVGVGARDTFGLEGRGIILGNVTGLADPAQRTSKVNTTAIESFYLSGNRVFGRETEAFDLINDRTYKVEVAVSAKADREIAYSIVDTATGKAAQRRIVDTYGLADWFDGWFIAEVFGNHAWELQFNDVRWS